MTNEQRELVERLCSKDLLIAVCGTTEAATTIEQLAERCERLEAALSKNTQDDAQITHSPGCWSFGPRHYECACQRLTEYIEKDEGHPGITKDLEEAQAALTAERTRREALEAALREYGNHVSPCATGRSPKLLKEFGLTRWPCTCGFDAALAAAETEVKP